MLLLLIMPSSSPKFSRASSQGVILVGSYNLGASTDDWAVVGVKKRNDPTLSIDGLKKFVVEQLYGVLDLLQDSVGRGIVL